MVNSIETPSLFQKNNKDLHRLIVWSEALSSLVPREKKNNVTFSANKEVVQDYLLDDN